MCIISILFQSHFISEESKAEEGERQPETHLQAGVVAYTYNTIPTQGSGIQGHP